MKKFILIPILALTCTAVFAQFKAQVGINIPNLSAPPLGRDFESNNGFTIGGSYMFGNQFYIEPGIQYATFQYKFYRTLEPSEALDIDSRSIRIPLLFGGRFMPKDDNFNIRAFTGPSISWVFSEDIDFKNLELDERNAVLWAWTVGYGVDYKMLFFEISYDFGLSNYFETQNYDSRNAKHNKLTLCLGVNLFR